MKVLNTIQNFIFRLGAILLTIGLFLHLFYPLLGMVIFVLGVFGFTIMQICARYEGHDITISRLRRQQLLSDVFFLLSAFAMLLQYFHFGPMWARRNLWILLLVIGCILQLYTAFRIPSELGKGKGNHFKNSRFIIFLLLPFISCSCVTQYNVIGSTNVQMLEGETLYLKIFSNDNMMTFDSCQVQHGRISFHGALDSVQMVSIFFNDEGMMPMVLESGQITLTINDNNQNVTGSPMNDTLYNFIRSKVRLDNEMNDLFSKEDRMILDGVPEYERDQILNNESRRISIENDKLVTSFIIKNSDNVLGPGVFMIMTSGYPFPQLTPQIEEILFRAKPYFKNHPYVRGYIEAAKKNMEKIHTGTENK